MTDRPFDLIYCAQLIQRKCPMFVVDVMKRLPGTRLLAIGDGPLRQDFYGELVCAGINFGWKPKVAYEDMPAMFAQAKICLFPTLLDTWGIVANEALAAGCPVITTPQAGCAGDLVIDGEGGYVLPLVVEEWVFAIRSMLYVGGMWCNRKHITPAMKGYSIANSARAIMAACEFANEGRKYRETRITYEMEG